VELTFINNNDTSALSAQTLINMLDSVQVINYSQYLTLLGQDPGDDRPPPLVFADYKLNESNIDNPLKITFTTGYTLDSTDIQDVLVLVKFNANSIIRSFRTRLSDVIAYDYSADSPVKMTGKDDQRLISSVYSTSTNDPKEGFFNYPNPFGQPPHETTKIVFYLNTTTSADVTVRIFTLMGELVKSKWHKNLENLARGNYDGYLEWDGRNDRGYKVLNGVYLCIIEINTNGMVQKYVTKIAYIK
jgi:hypothetical protein